MSETEKQYTLSEAAAILGVTTKTLRNWDRDGKLNTTRTAGGHRRVSHDEIARMVRSQTPYGAERMNSPDETLVPITADDPVEEPTAGNNKSVIAPAVAMLSKDKNPDEVIDFARQLVHRIEDQLNSRLTDEEYKSFEEIVFNTHERGLPKAAPKRRPGHLAPLLTPKCDSGGYRA